MTREGGKDTLMVNIVDKDASGKIENILEKQQKLGAN